MPTADSTRFLLYVDDSEVVRTLFALLVRPHGFRVVTVSSYDAAREALLAVLPHCVVTDVNLGPNERTGLDLVRYIRGSEHALLKLLPVIVISFDEREGPKALASGATLFLPKSQLSVPALGDALAQALR